jgi:glycosyltransferase involved in cell wall biosynthesis
VTETFGNVTLEAMASGLAVVAYRYAAARQHIEDGVNGLLAEPGDRAGFIGHAVSLAHEPRRARELGRAARIAAAPVSWERITADFDAVLRETALAHATRRESAHAAA